jgi:hypothetical protein
MKALQSAKARVPMVAWSFPEFAVFTRAFGHWDAARCPMETLPSPALRALKTSGLLIRDARASGATGNAAAPPRTVPLARERWHAPDGVR